MEINVEGPRPFTPKADGSTPTSPHPATPATPAAPEDLNPWKTWWTDKRGMEVIALARNNAARILDEPKLKADAGTLEFAGPPLAACIGALPIGSVAGVSITDGRIALLGLVLILALAVALPIYLVIRNRRRRKERKVESAVEMEAPAEQAPSRFPTPGRSRFAGSGQLE